MLKKNNRLVKQSEFDEVRGGGRVWQSPLFGLAVIKKDDKEKKVGFVVSKKIAKKAVVRNRIRRLLAEGVRHHWGEIEEGTRMIFLVRQTIVDKGQMAVESEVARMLEEIRKK